MNTQPAITCIDREDPRCQAALSAEERLFAHYGLSYREHFVDMDAPKLRLRVLEVGAGRPLLLVPGGTGDALFFAPLMAELDGWRMIAVNRPGGGLSDGVDHRQVDLRRLAADAIRAVADAFDLERVPIVCNSMGGLWSFWYALAHPQRVSRMAQMGCPALVLETSAPFFMRLLSVPGLNRFIVGKMQPQNVDGALEGLRLQGSSREQIERMPGVGGEAAYHIFNIPTYRDSWKTLVSAVATPRGARSRYQLRAEQLRRVTCPVQFVWGDNDPFGGLDVARRITAIMPDARLHEMQAGHLPFLDEPEATGRIIRAFLAEEPDARRDPAARAERPVAV